jgi:hypothetical protein
MESSAPENSTFSKLRSAGILARSLDMKRICPVLFPPYNAEMPRSISFQGCSLSFGERGRGEPVVFIQGVGLHGEGWRPQTDVLCMGPIVV